MPPRQAPVGPPLTSTVSCPQPMHNADCAPIREHLLAAVLRFVVEATRLPGVSRIALIGSLASTKQQPKDADVLVTVSNEACLIALARLGRQLKGAAQSRNHGADIFLADPDGKYIGRTCNWRECRPGLRVACQAAHCGRRKYLYDDLHIVELGLDLVRKPPIVVWPGQDVSSDIPADVRKVLLQPLAAHPTTRS